MKRILWKLLGLLVVEETLQVFLSKRKRKFKNKFGQRNFLLIYHEYRFSKGLGSCLDDKPTTEEKFKYPELPAGAMYDATIQCQLQFGNKGTEVCTPLPEVSKI